MKVRFLKLADREVDDAVIWYDEQTPGLGIEFLDELDRAVRLVKICPLASTQIEPEIRRFLLRRFPYSLVYGVDDETIVVIAVAHQHREPRYWADRLDDLLDRLGFDIDIVDGHAIDDLADHLGGRDLITVVANAICQIVHVFPLNAIAAV